LQTVQRFTSVRCGKYCFSENSSECSLRELGMLQMGQSAELVIS